MKSTDIATLKDKFWRQINVDLKDYDIEQKLPITKMLEQYWTD